MNSQRKTCALFCIFFVLFAMHINAMEPQPPIIVISQESFSNRDLLLLGTGIAFGAGCVGLACWYNNHQQRLNSLERKIEKIQEDQQILENRVKYQKQLQEEEIMRLGQTRAWVMDDRKKQDKQKIKTAINHINHEHKIKKLKKRVDTLENKEIFYSCPSSSSAE